MIPQLIKNSPNTYKHFEQWLLVAYKGDKSKVRKFRDLSPTYAHVILLQYLEEDRKVPVLKMLTFYDALRHQIKFLKTWCQAIEFEFMRLEQGKETEYEIF